ncbi:Sulfotransferase [Candidatus Magnetomorum sp. HK-1]|nr:Sulfotransferase [Candidatus Magnetomorum sp. HK-1]
MKLQKIVQAVSKDTRALYPFQYYTACEESIFCFVYSSHSVNAKAYFHYDNQKRLLAKTILGDVIIDTKKINVFDEIENKTIIENQDFKDLFFEMHLASSCEQNRWYDKNVLAKINSMYPKPPIIIGGCGRSGTTLLLSILGAHPSIQAINDETYAFYPYPFRLSLLSFALDQKISKQKTRWCEKTPKNVRAFGDILKLFDSNVRLLHIVRDPRDVVTSVHPNHPAKFWVPIERWVEDVQVGLNHKNQTLIVRYEDLVLDTEKTIRIICDYIGETFEKKMLNIQKYSSVKQNAAWGKEKVKSIHHNSIKKWEKPEYKVIIDHLMENEKAVQLMRELGYI